VIDANVLQDGATQAADAVGQYINNNGVLDAVCSVSDMCTQMST
jgi:hypothetical protein